MHTHFYLQLAGQHNAMNAVAAILASSVCAVMQSMKLSTASEALLTGRTSQGLSCHVSSMLAPTPEFMHA